MALFYAWVARDDKHLGLRRGEVLVIEPGTASPIRALGVSSRVLPTNFGYLAGLIAEGAMVPLSEREANELALPLPRTISRPPGRRRRHLALL